MTRLHDGRSGGESSGDRLVSDGGVVEEAPPADSNSGGDWPTNIGPTTIDRLREHGYASVEEARDAGRDELEQVPGVGRILSARIMGLDPADDFDDADEDDRDTREAIKEDIAWHVEKYGFPPNTGQFEDRCEHSIATLYNYFPSIKVAIESAGFDPAKRGRDPRTISDEAMLEDLARVSQERGNNSRTKYQRKGSYSATSAALRFRVFDDAWKAADRYVNGDDPQEIIRDLFVPVSERN